MRALRLALSLLLALALAEVATAAPIIRESSGRHYFPDGVGSRDVLNILDYGGFNDATGTTGTDNCTAITAMVAARPTNGAIYYFPPGRYVTTCPISLKTGDSLVGGGRGTSTIQTPNATDCTAAGVPYSICTGNGTTSAAYSLVQVATPRTCSSGSGGACDATIASSGRGAGCLCYKSNDCQSNSCTGGTVQRDVYIANLKFLQRLSNGIALDMALFGESVVEKTNINTAGGLTNTTGIVWSDGGGIVSGYSDHLYDSKIQAFTICARVMDRANDVHFERNFLTSSCGTGLQIDSPTHTVHVTGNVFQSPATSGVSVLDAGTDNEIRGNYFEANTGTHIQLTATAARDLVDRNYFTGSATKIVDQGAAATHKVEGCLGASAPVVACAAATTGICYFDYEQFEVCVCNGTAYTQQDGGGTTGCS